MQEHYLSGRHLHQATASRSDFGIWKWICSSKYEALMCAIRKMGNGRDISLVYDCWSPGRLVDSMHQDSISAEVHGWTIADIVLEGYWFMKDPWLLSIWPQNRSQVVHDTVANKCVLHGAGHCRKLACLASLLLESSTLFQVSNVIWFHNHSPKMVVCLLRAIHNNY